MTMTLLDYYNRQLPDYYDGMYLDGYEPWQILEAKHRSMKRAYYAQREAERAAAEQNEVWNVKITSEVKIK